MRITPPKTWMLLTIFLLLIQCLPLNAFALAEDDLSQEPVYVLREFEPDINYLLLMQEHCMSGDIEAGEEAEILRNLKIDVMELREKKIAFWDLFLLSKLIALEAGSSWLSMEWKMSVGEVLLNRVASPEFPDSIEACINQPGQYASVNSSRFQAILPDYDSVIAASRLLNGERILNSNTVIFQSNSVQGEIFRVLHDERLGNTYLCMSNHPELYPAK